MKKAISIFVGAVLGVICLTQMICAEVNISAEVDRTALALSETLTLTLKITGGNEVSNLQSPIDERIPFFIVSQSQSTQMSWVNGVTSYVKEFRYILKPKAKGNFTIPPISFGYNGQETKTDPIQIQVVDNPPQSSGMKSQTKLSSEQDKRRSAQQNVFVRNSLARTSFYVGEVIPMAFEFFYRVRFWGQPQYTPPQTTGFLLEGGNNPPDSEVVEVEGSKYNMNRQNYFLIPSLSGSYTIGQGKLEYVSSPFEGPRAVMSDPIKVTVKPLPSEGKPADFSGAVGEFSLTAKTDKKTCKGGAPIQLTITISGRGDLRRIGNLTMPELKDFRIFEAKDKVTVDKSNNVFRSNKTYEYILMPLSEGTITIPAVSFSYFDPESRSYKSITTKAIDIQSADLGAQSTGTEEKVVYQEGLRKIRDEIIFIKEEPIRKPLPLGSWVLVISFLVTIVNLIIWLVSKLNIQASPQARARRWLNKIKINQPAEAVGLMQKAITIYLSSKHKQSVAGMNRESIRLMLGEAKLEQGKIESITTLLDQLDMFRYAPSSFTAEEIEKLKMSVERIL